MHTPVSAVQENGKRYAPCSAMGFGKRASSARWDKSCFVEKKDSVRNPFLSANAVRELSQKLPADFVGIGLMFGVKCVTMATHDC